MSNINRLVLVLDVCCVSCEVEVNWKYAEIVYNVMRSYFVLL